MFQFQLPPGYVPTVIPPPEPEADLSAPGFPAPAPAPALAPEPEPAPEPLPYGYALTASGLVLRSDGLLIPNDPANADRAEFEFWLSAGNEAAPYVPVAMSGAEVLSSRFAKRAAVKDRLIAAMAAENVARVQDQVWTVQDLASLLTDLEPVLAMMQSLSFELAAQAIAASTQPLLTPDIKAGWVAQLQAHFYPEG